MKTILRYVICMMFPIVCWGQNVDEIEVNRIKADKTYLWGEGTGETEWDADQRAVSSLMSQISVTVQSAFDLSVSNVSEGQDAKTRSAMESVIKTYSSGHLNNSGKVSIRYDNSYYVLRYIENSEIEREFKAREECVFDYMHSAQTAEREGRIGDALRYYYWGFCLLKSLQRPNQVVYASQGKEYRLSVWIPEQINYLLNNLTAEVAQVEDDLVDLMIKYKGEPVACVDFTYYDGMGFSNIFSAKNGLAQIEMRPGAPTESIQLRYEYAYRGQMKGQGNGLELVADLPGHTPFAKAEVIIQAGKRSAQKRVMEQYQDAVATAGLAMTVEKVDKPKEMSKIIFDIVDAVKENDYEEVKDYFTEGGYEMFNKLLNYGHARVLGNPVLNFYKMGERTVCRSIPMQFSFQNNNRQFVEEVTFTFDAKGKIESLAFALDKTARDDIFCRNVAWGQDVKMAIATFLENYKTAFALERLDYIKSIFDDNAIIIVGCMTKKAPQTVENQRFIDNEYVRYTRQNKTQYLKNLERTFRSNQFINIRFTDNDVMQLGYPGEVFGIQIHQDYYSSTYGDTGYLFLMVDMGDPNQPLIKVRAWQPRRDPTINANLGTDSKYYGLIYGGNFD